MLIRFLAFWENSFNENIGKLCGKIRVPVTMLHGWLRINKKVKHRSEHTQQNQKQVKVWSGDDAFLEKMDIHPTLPNILGI